MKRFALFALALSLTLSAVRSSDTEALRRGFLSPPMGGGAQSWWHWTSLFVTKEGITHDLEAMKAIGYETAHIFSTTSSPQPPGDYPEVLSEGWLDLLRHAGEEAARLGLTLGIHNCPGWSLSGGPWIRPEDAMQMLVSSESSVRGGSAPIVLPAPEVRNDFYRDIAVLAFPDVNSHEQPEITTDFACDSLANLFDRDYESYIRLPIREPGSRAVITLEYPLNAFSRPVQFIELAFEEIHLFVKGTVEASADGANYRTAAEFDYRIRTDLGMPKYIRLNSAAQGARFFRITFEYRPYRIWMRPANVRLNEVRLLATSMVDDVDTRNSAMEDAYSFKPFAPDYTTPGIDPAQVLNLTDRLLPDGTLDAVLPAGNWTVLRIGHTPTGKTNGPSNLNGLECNKMDRRGLDAHWPEMMGKVIETLRESGTLKYAIIDSYEAGGQNWTYDLPEQFLRRRGYTLTEWLPATLGFVVGTPRQSARFLHDFQRTISELFAENYYDYFTELCHRNGLLSVTEAYFGPFDYQRAARNADIPTAEFWISWPHSASRMPGSVGHVHGQKRVAAESFTVDQIMGRWQQDPKQLKEYGDRAWIQGVSQLVMHSYVHQPLLNVQPGWSLDRFGSHLNRNNTWWSRGDAWVSYINRSQFLLQAGLPVSEILMLSGESNPNRFPMYDTLLRAGYNYDFCCAYDLRDMLRAEEGRVVAPSGTTYDCLSLGDDQYLTLPTLEKIYAFLQAGIAVAGLRPIGSPSLSDDDAAWAAMADRIWGDARPGDVQAVGRGRIALTADPMEAVKLLGIVPGVELPEHVYSLHRRVGDTEIFFLYNDSPEGRMVPGRFRVAEGLMPECWNADGGAMEPAAVWSRSGEQTTVPLWLAPHGSLFIIFRPGDAPHLRTLESTEIAPDGAPAVSARMNRGKVELLFATAASATLTRPNGTTKTFTANPPAPLDLSTDWKVSFPSGVGAPTSIELPALASLSEYADDGVRYFAGTATYTRTIEVPKGWKHPSRCMVLDLGNVKNLAEVTVNGSKLPILWKEPFAIDITDYLSMGRNTLTIAVTTLWPNRIIGDARNTAPVSTRENWPDWVLDDRPDSSIGHYSFSHWKGWRAEDELLPSGLIGPVVLRCLEVR